MRLQNLHTHSTYCDGKNTLRELAEEAVKKGFCTLGFSSHSFTEFDQSYCMKNESEYIRECAGLKEEYKDRLDILRGLELDYYSDAPKYPYDYLIGSVHYIYCRGEFFTVDESPQILEEAAKKYFGGDIMAICEKYYDTVADVVRKTDCDIIGHFDLITKFCEVKPGLIDLESQSYRKAVSRALDMLIDSGRIFELNTGAIAKGYRTLPYPSPEIVRRLADSGAKFTISSDCHKKEQLDFWFEDAKKYLVANGVKKVYLYNNGIFEEERISG